MQLLGAEKALFRHLKTGSRPPKYGVIVNHQLISTAKASDKGRMARVLADKASIAARVDFFKGDYVADKLIREINKKRR